MFDINDARAKLEELEKNYQDLLKHPLNLTIARTTISDAWHLVDWVLLEKKLLNPSLTIHDFRANIYRDCSEMRILHDLANTDKHKILDPDRKKSYIKETNKHSGTFDNTFSKTFNTDRLEVHLESGEIHYVDDLVKTAIRYWRTILNNDEEE